MIIGFRAAMAILALLMAGEALAETRLPDNDENQFNNTPGRSEVIDVLRLDSAGKPRGVQISGNLGAVLGKFDTADWYRFKIPPGQWKLQFLLNETPMTTMAMYLYRNPNAAPIEKGRGNDFERFERTLDAGDYFLQIFTTPGSANGRLLRYSLSVQSALVPLPDTAGPACSSAQNLGRITKSARIQGSLSPAEPVDAYQFYIEGDAQAQVTRQNGWIGNTVTLIARNGDAAFTLAEPDKPGSKIYWIDPGFYCLKLQLPATSGESNYDVDVIAPASGIRPIQPPPGGAFVTQYDLGNLSENGRYKDQRYINRFAAPELVPSREHTIREWISAEQRENWYGFTVNRGGKLKIDVQRTFNRIGLELRDESGAIVATGQSTGTPLDRYLPSTNLSATLEPGHYHIRLSYLSDRAPGTSYSMQVFFVED